MLTTIDNTRALDWSERIARKAHEEDRGYHSACWIWTGLLDDRGYTAWSYRSPGRVNTHRTKVHRAMWLALRGDLIEGLELDHLCRQITCVNPWHLDPVTREVNRARAVAARNPHPVHPTEPYGGQGCRKHGTAGGYAWADLKRGRYAWRCTTCKDDRKALAQAA